MLAALAAVSGAATGFFNPASTALMPAVVAPERLQQANGLRATALSAGEILGPLAAGVIVASNGAGWAVAIDAATFAISAALLFRLRDVGVPARESGSFLDDLKEGWWDFRSRRWLWTLIASVAIGNTVWGAWSALGPVVADRDLGGAAAWGSVLAALGVGALVGSVIATRAAPRRPLVWWSIGTFVFALPLAFLAARAPVALLAFSAFLGGGAMMLGNSIWESTLQRHIPDESLSRVAAYDWFGSLAFYPLGLAAFGPIAGAIGLSPTLWIAFAVQVATGLALLAIPDIRNLPASPAAAELKPLPATERVR
jgi:predicted MFS family arabinose efflux permease